MDTKFVTRLWLSPDYIGNQRQATKQTLANSQKGPSWHGEGLGLFFFWAEWFGLSGLLPLPLMQPVSFPLKMRNHRPGSFWCVTVSDECPGGNCLRKNSPVLFIVNPILLWKKNPLKQGELADNTHKYSWDTDRLKKNHPDGLKKDSN